MARPVYILAARGLSEDKSTNLVTLFNLLETLTVTVTAEGDRELPERVAVPSKLAVLAVWMREDGDENFEFEQQFQVHFPNAVDTLTLKTFRFEAGKDLSRFILQTDALPVPTVDAYVEFEHRIRPIGGEWASQRYPLKIVHERVQPAPANAE